MAHIVTLKDNNDEISYPITPVDAVFVDSNTTLSDELADIINKIYPVGSIYMSATLSTAAAVSAALGGTWVAWGAGRVPVGVDTSDVDFDTAEETGGEKTHTLTVTEMPSHDHNVTKSGVANSNLVLMAAAWDVFGAAGNATGSGNWLWNKGVPPQGGDGAHNNLQPYITCYMYKRIA